MCNFGRTIKAKNEQFSRSDGTAGHVVKATGSKRAFYSIVERCFRMPPPPPLRSVLLCHTCSECVRASVLVAPRRPRMTDIKKVTTKRNCGLGGRGGGKDNTAKTFFFILDCTSSVRVHEA